MSFPRRGSDLFEIVDRKHRPYKAKRLARPGTIGHLASARHNRGGHINSGEPHLEATMPSEAPRYQEAYRCAMVRHGPPSLIVDEASLVVHVSEFGNKYLRYVGGELSHDVFGIFLPQLRLELRAAMFDAKRNSNPIETKAVRLRIWGEPGHLGRSRLGKSGSRCVSCPS